MADRIYRTALPMLRCDKHAAPFRLLGVGISGVQPVTEHVEAVDLLDPHARKRLAAEQAADRIRARFGGSAITFGRSLG
jgi:DNA polymerase-4